MQAGIDSRLMHEEETQTPQCIKQLIEENTRDIALRFPNFRPLFETSILVDAGTNEEKHRIALENGYYALAEYLCQSTG